jgi:hypothetical protein
MKYLKVLSSVILGFFFLWLALKNADLSEAASRAFALDPLWLAVSVFSFFYTQFIRAARWHMLSGAFAAGFIDSFKVFYIGLFANYVLPFRLGEFSRPLIMKKTHNASFSATLGVIFVERLLDLSGQVFLLIFVLWFSPLPVNNRLVEYIKIALVLVAFIFTAGFAALKFISKGGALRSWFAARLYSLAPAFKAKISLLLKSFNEGAGVYGDKKRLAAAFIYTLISWFVSAATIMFSMRAMGIELASPFLSACFIQAAISVALVIPPPPGFVGTFHYFCKEGLMFYAVAQNAAVAYAVFFHALQIILIAVPAAFFMAAYGIGFGDFMKKEEGNETARGRI